MLQPSGQSSLTRRSLILLAGAGFLPCRHVYGYGKEFWETRDPDQWNSDEIARLLTKSPWAKTASAQRVKTARNSTPSNPFPRGRSSRLPGDPGGNRREPPARTVTTYNAIVVWESAAPVRAALKTALPEAFRGQYVLGVSGVPLAKSDSRNALDRLRQVSTLQSKGRQPLEAAGVQEDTGNGTVYFFGFSREALPLSKDDKDLVFTTHMGKLAFTARFNPKDMLYHGELAV